MYKYICKRENRSIWSYLIDCESDRTIELHKDAADQAGLHIGDIYIAKVERIVSNIGAAFVKINSQQSAYLPLEDIKRPVYTAKGSSREIQQGDEIVVQIKRDSIKGKLPAVTTLLSLQGTYVSVELGTGVSVSKKLSKDVRQNLRILGDKLLIDMNEKVGKISSEKEDRSVSILFRTKAGEAEMSDVEAEASRLTCDMEELLKKAPFRTCYSCIYSSPAKYLDRLRHMDTADLEKIVTDEDELYDEMKSYLNAYVPDAAEKLRRYDDPMLDMKLLYSLERRKSEALRPIVLLPSGGSIVISPTEALTAIDVNSGKNIITSGKKTKETAVLKQNLEAAKEIAHQLRLRNVSGIIIVDFINMEEDESIKQLMVSFAQMLSEDPVKTVLVDITKLGLVEITRKKTEKPLWEE